MNSARGFTLVEAVVSIGLLTSGLIAFAYAAWLGTQLRAEAKYRTYATIAASQKLEQLRAVRSLSDTTGASEYLDAEGNLACVVNGPCGGEVYVRSWSVATATKFPQSVLIEVSARHAHRSIGAVRLTTLRKRNVP